MAEEMQAGICGGDWWASSRSILGGCSSPFLPAMNDTGSYGWAADAALGTKAVSFSYGFPDAHKADRGGGGGGGVLLDSTLQMMGFGLSSPATSDWNQSLMCGGERGENAYVPVMQENMNSKLSFSGATEDSGINAIKPISQEFCLEDQQQLNLNPITTSASEASSYVYPSTLMQGLLCPDSQPQQSFFNAGSLAYGTVPNEISPAWSLSFPLPKSSFSDMEAGFLASSHSQFPASTYEEKPTSRKPVAKPTAEEVQQAGSMGKTKRDGNGPGPEPASAFKRPRIETPSPLPTFKVRKEKLGDRITALQQLVSPFGKTDTASVLHEAIDYIKFLHDQVSVLSTPYMKNGAAPQHQQASDRRMEHEEEGAQQDLRSRGLCLVPISSTIPVANETAVDFWTPAFGGNFR